ncbi:MAG TPA: asparagine--tRNA ligase [Candidatus Pacearchaeota archaeon]|nr:asparagine--tRNA ligase [Candidatus Pacearchaeota archaeon]HOU45593.1 asparagine--tRNA ligase [Candidatus Pacearchaeota archaeon]HPM08551.1 asparagine--tRNA ligase [Candidatus Pacearchaeota archaeon]HQI74250.1 asparagine--tRNA ligase [Candidatus Pacearchaeota archaeon]
MDKIEIKKIISDYKSLLDGKLAVCGWIKNIRSSKGIGFIELNDGTVFKGIQIVFENTLENFLEIEKLPIGTSICVKGLLVKSLGAGQEFELKAEEIEIIGESDPEYPLQKKGHSFEYLRTISHLRPRSNTFSAVFKVRSLAAQAIHKFFAERDFVYVHTPIITGSDCEGAGEMFHVTAMDLNNIPKQDSKIDYSKDFFGKETGLTVSGQLEAESFAMAFSKVYTFGPTFRAENSNTKRHAAEFWMVEPEIAFATLKEDMALAQELIKYIIKYILENATLEMEFFSKFIDKDLIPRLQNILDSEFEHITYTEAIKILQDSGKKFEYNPEWGKDLQTEHERYLTNEIYKKPVFVTDYPKEFKAFYMRQNDDGKTVAAMDLLVPGVGEIIGGSQREERYDRLLSRMKEMNMNESDYSWYLDLRKYGGTPHAGFGLGFERLIMYLTGMENIRDVIPFPRTPGNAEM